MLPLLLILVLSIYVYHCVRFMLRRGHDLHALAFFVLYVYTVFTQIGYAYFPAYSILVGAYFGPTLFYKYWIFMFLSFVFTFLLYKKMFPKNDMRNSYYLKPTNSRLGENLFFLFCILLFITLNIYFHTFRSSFGYGGGNPMGGPWFGIGFWIFIVCTLILFVFFREKSNTKFKRMLSGMLFLVFILFFLQVSIASGVRSNILYIFLSLAFYELFPLVTKIKFQKRKIFALAIGSFFVFSLMGDLRLARQSGLDLNFSLLFSSEVERAPNQNLAQSILMQDYFLPSHTLFISMNYEIIDPIEVTKSNLANSLVLLKYPFLSTTIVETATGVDYERGGGWAYHYFVEGYNFLGMFGIFYNALFWNLGMLLWFKLGQSNNKMLNKFMLTLSVLTIVLVMRSQTSAFIHFYWLVLLPGLVLYLMANNSLVRFYKKTKLLNKNE